MLNNSKKPQNTKERGSENEGIEQIVPILRKQHKYTRQDVINSLYERSIKKLIDGYMFQIDCKNAGYYFIIESGLFNLFKDYCETHNTFVDLFNPKMFNMPSNN
jgi:hypothetical protein